MDDDAQDILSDALTILGVERDEDPGFVQYGPLRLTVAPKEGKANTLLADQLFSPALALAELIERGVIQVADRRIVELGAGCGLPSLLAATMVQPPSLIVATDYPDEGILGNLRANVERNNPHYRLPCRVSCIGYEWGTDTTPLLDLSQCADHTLRGYDVVIMSDLLHFDASHGELVHSLISLLARSAKARAYVAAGNYTAPHVCEHFVKLATAAGLVWEEETGDTPWAGSMVVSGLDVAQLTTRKVRRRPAMYGKISDRSMNLVRVHFRDEVIPPISRDSRDSDALFDQGFPHDTIASEAHERVSQYLKEPIFYVSFAPLLHDKTG